MGHPLDSELLFGDLIPLARYPSKEGYYINVSLGIWEEVDPKATKSKKTTATSSLFLKTFAMSHQIIRFDFSNFSQSFRTIVCWLIFFFCYCQFYFLEN